MSVRGLYDTQGEFLSPTAYRNAPGRVLNRMEEMAN